MATSIGRTILPSGFLDCHACGARAVVETRLNCLPLKAQSSAIEGNAKAQLKLDEAIEREFEFRRAVLVVSGQQSPLKRVAAFLISLSRMSAREGRDPWWVADSCPSGFVADLLGLNVESLVTLLAERERRGLIEACPRAGLRLKDIDALEEFAAEPISAAQGRPSGTQLPQDYLLRSPDWGTSAPCRGS